MSEIKTTSIIPSIIFAFVLSIVLTGIMRKIAIKLEITDKPNFARKTQKEPVPYLGGLAIIFSFLITVFMGIQFLSPSREVVNDMIFLLLPATFLGFIGLWDDVKDLSPHFRLMIQVFMGLFGSLTITFGSTSGSATGNPTTDLILSIFWIVGVTNALNFFDNIDGGAAVASFMSATGIALYSFFTRQLYLFAFGLTLMGSLLGFFYWNRRPARIYMGDSGSLFLGILLATITMRIDPQTDSKWTSFAVPILLLALPILDTSVVVLNRLSYRRSPLQGGRDHLSHRLSNRGIRHRYILYIFGGIALIFQLPIYVFLQVSSRVELILTFIAIAAFFLLFAWFSSNKVNYERD